MMIIKRFNDTYGRRLGGGKEYQKLFASFMDDFLFQFVINWSWVLFEVTFGQLSCRFFKTELS